MSDVIRRFYQSRVYRAWVNRCARCLRDPFHDHAVTGEET